ncbi:hypothetical protein C7B64_21810 [Merismopedia glauca CCAP 1448/3]|uniref:Uncharacterized protein n=1 Tax=Merismopedia glauca CCAP 1448/3 TaxID=1296344 RepID=A0A2T1BXM8_9CYAN|nr:hypothetical protein C7B64_21810 [Merismopedia glauca CCAP 1448/3]
MLGYWDTKTNHLQFPLSLGFQFSSQIILGFYDLFAPVVLMLTLTGVRLAPIYRRWDEFENFRDCVDAAFRYCPNTNSP